MEKPDSESKREFFKEALVLGVSGGVAVAKLHSLFYLMSPNHRISYLEALRGTDSQKQRFLDQLVQGEIPPEVSFVKYVTPQIAPKFRRFGLIPTDEEADVSLVAIVNQNGEVRDARLEEIGKGIIQSEVYVGGRFFRGLQDPRAKSPKHELYKDIEIIIENNIVYYQFALANLLNKGIPDYPVAKFKNSDGNINDLLYLGLVQLLSLGSAYKALFEHPRTIESKYLQIAASVMAQGGFRVYSVLFNKDIVHGMDKGFIEELRRKFDPSKIFPKYQFQPS